MGLFSFFKRSGKAKANAPLKSPPRQAEDPAVEETIYRGRPEFSQSELTLDTTSVDERPAPPPGVPRYRDESVERPSTAPSERPPSSSFTTAFPRSKRNGQRRPPPLSFRMTRPETATPGPRPSSRGSLASITSIFRRTSGHSRSNSVRSDAGKAFKDILDAQSEIKPADFKARVKAAGVRDYGEDVAERNMAQNGFDLESPHVQSFYYAASREAEFLSNAGPKLDPYKAGVRRRPTRSSSQCSMPGHIASEGPARRHFERRRSVNTYLPASSSTRKLDVFNRSPAALIDSLSRISSHQMHKIEKDDFGLPSRGLRSPIWLQSPETAPAPTIRTARRLRDSVELAKKRAEPTRPEDDLNHDSSPVNCLPRSSTALPASLLPPRHRSLCTLRASVSLSAASKDNLMHTTALSYPRKPTLQNQIEEATETSSAQGSPVASDDEDLATPLGSVLAPLPSTILRLRGEAASSRPPSRSISRASTRADNAIALPDDDFLEYPPPIRTRSMRGWSASSGTPTAAESTAASIATTASSQPFHRPPSLHTADTSVDNLVLGNASPQLKPTRTLHNSDNSSESDPDNSSSEDVNHAASAPNLETNPGPSTKNVTALCPPPPVPAHTSADNFNIDDYLSSDADSFATTPNRRPTAEGEEELLFNDLLGYGAGGMQLPGLIDPFPACPSSSPPRPHQGLGNPAKAKESGKNRRRVWGMRSSPVLAPSSYEYGVAHLDGVGLEVGRCDGDHRQRLKGNGIGGSFGRVEGRRAKSQMMTMMMMMMEEERRTRTRRFVLDTAAHEDESEPEEGSGWYETRFGTRCLNGEFSDDDDAGYEADFVEDEDEGVSQRHGKGKRRKVVKLAALCSPDPREGGHGQKEDSTGEEKLQSKVDFAAAVRLRKELKKARRLAGEPSPARLRRERPAKQEVEARMSNPVLRFVEA
ncbi:hypothetical protein VTI74DRAFT_2949 [Chaetomium olivicolor]